MAQLGVETPKQFTYFGLKTPVAFASQILLEMSGSDYEGISIQFEQWGELKAKTPTGMLPYAVMPDGSVLAESGAIGRTIAASMGALGQGKDFMKSEQLAGMTADLNKKVMGLCPTVMTVANFDDAKKKAFEEGKAGCLENVEKYVPFLSAAGDRFTDSGMTYGEVDLFSKLNCYATGALPEVATGGLAAFYNRMAADTAVKRILEGKSKFGPIGNYLIPIP